MRSDVRHLLLLAALVRIGLAPAETLPVGSDFCSSPPTDLTTGLSRTAVRVLAPEAIPVGPDGLPTGAFWPSGPDAFTWAIFGDTQDYYALTNPATSGEHYSPRPGEVCTNASFTARVDWLLAQCRARNIRLVTHLGDLVENLSNEREVDYAVREMRRLASALPVFVSPGNHDQYWGDTSVFAANFSSVLAASDPARGLTVLRFPGFTGTNWTHHAGAIEAAARDEDIAFDPARDVGPVGDGGANSCLILTEGSGRRLLFLFLQCSVPKPVLDWADGLLRTHADAEAIVVEHEYLGRMNYRLGYRSADERCNIGRMRCKRYAQNGSTSAQYQWERHWARHPNVRLVVCGHEPEGLSVLTEERGDGGNTVLAVLQNYPQTIASDWIRLARFDRAGDRIFVYTYSPGRRRLCRGDEPEFAGEFAFATNVPHHFVIDLAALRRRTRAGALEPLRTVADDPRGRPYVDLRPFKDGFAFWNADQAFVTRVAARLDGNGRLEVRYRALNDYTLKIGQPGEAGCRGGLLPIRHVVRPRFWIDDGARRWPVPEEAVVSGAGEQTAGGWKSAELDLGRIGLDARSLTNAVVTVALEPLSKDGIP